MLVAFAFRSAVIASASSGRTHVEPVGGSVATAAETILLDEGLQQYGRVPILSLKILRYLASGFGEDMAGQILDPNPGENEKSAVVENPLQSPLPLLPIPADPKVPRFQHKGRRPEADRCRQPLDRNQSDSGSAHRRAGYDRGSDNDRSDRPTAGLFFVLHLMQLDCAQFRKRAAQIRCWRFRDLCSGQPIRSAASVAVARSRLGKHYPALPMKPKQRDTRPHLFEIASCIALIQRDTDPPDDLAAMDRFTLAVADDLSYNTLFILPKGAAADLLGVAVLWA